MIGRGTGQKKNAPGLSGPGRIYSAVPPGFAPCGAHSAGVFAPCPDIGGPPPGPTGDALQPGAPGRLPRRPREDFHQPSPLFASALRVLLPFLAVHGIAGLSIIHPVPLVKRQAAPDPAGFWENPAFFLIPPRVSPYNGGMKPLRRLWKGGVVHADHWCLRRRAGYAGIAPGTNTALFLRGGAGDPDSPPFPADRRCWITGAGWASFRLLSRRG